MSRFCFKIYYKSLKKIITIKKLHLFSFVAIFATVGLISCGPPPCDPTEKWSNCYVPTDTATILISSVGEIDEKVISADVGIDAGRFVILYHLQLYHLPFTIL